MSSPATPFLANSDISHVFKQTQRGPDFIEQKNKASKGLFVGLCLQQGQDNGPGLERLHLDGSMLGLMLCSCCCEIPSNF